jgi:hypothetical protein
LLVIAIAAGAVGFGALVAPPARPPGRASACDATIATSAQLEAKLRSSATGEIVCLESGTYRRQMLADNNRRNYETFQPAHGAKVTLGGFELTNYSHVRFRNFTGGSRIAGGNGLIASDHIQLMGNTITGGEDALLIRATKDSLVQRNRMHGFSSACDASAPAGYVMWVNSYYGDGSPENGLEGLVIDRNDIGGNQGQDGIQLGGGRDNGSEDVAITNNHFHDLYARDSCSSDHSDSIQVIGGSRITVRGNTFRRVQNACLWGDDVLTDAVVEDNLMIGDRGVPGGVGIFCQIFDAERLTFRNNTVVRVPGASWLSGLLLRSSGIAASPSARVENNVLQDFDFDAGYNITASSNADLHAGPPRRPASYRGGFPFEDTRSFAPLPRLKRAVD